jgi:hypothetical protein
MVPHVRRHAAIDPLGTFREHPHELDLRNEGHILPAIVREDHPSPLRTVLTVNGLSARVGVPGLDRRRRRTRLLVEDVLLLNPLTIVQGMDALLLAASRPPEHLPVEDLGVAQGQRHRRDDRIPTHSLEMTGNKFHMELELYHQDEVLLEEEISARRAHRQVVGEVQVQHQRWVFEAPIVAFQARKADKIAEIQS